MLRALRPAVLLTLALAACAKPAAECPPGTAEHVGACRSTCRSDDQCLLGEHCSAGFCEAGSADAAVKPDGGTLDALGAPDAVDPGDAEPFKDGITQRFRRVIQGQFDFCQAQHRAFIFFRASGDLARRAIMGCR